VRGNDLRFERSVNGVLVKCVAAAVPPGAASGTAVDINPHLDYSSHTTTVVKRLQSVGDPRGVPVGEGPMATQTLFGAVGNEPFRWRGKKENLADFNEAYVNLQGRDSELTATEMESLQRYVASLTFGPNPKLNIDNSLRTSVPITGGVVTGPGGTGNAVNG
jgi:hypothetical protein